jgi:hypothetical protein
VDVRQPDGVLVRSTSQVPLGAINRVEHKPRPGISVAESFGSVQRVNNVARGVERSEAGQSDVRSNPHVLEKPSRPRVAEGLTILLCYHGNSFRPELCLERTHHDRLGGEICDGDWGSIAFRQRRVRHPRAQHCRDSSSPHGRVHGRGNDLGELRHSAQCGSAGTL